jgi:hypothetical protein
MTTIVILNIVLAAVVFAGVLSLLGWGIVSDNRLSLRLRSRSARESVRRAPRVAAL